MSPVFDAHVCMLIYRVCGLVCQLDSTDIQVDVVRFLSNGLYELEIRELEVYDQQEHKGNAYSCRMANMIASV